MDHTFPKVGTGMITRFLLTMILASCLAGPTQAEPVIEESRESRVTIEDRGGTLDIHVVNHRFEPAIVADDRTAKAEIRHFLVAIETDRTTREAADQETEILASIVHASARPIGPEGLGASTLDIAVPGDAAAISGPFLIVTRWGCCALQDSHAAYSLLTGKRLFSATGQGAFGDWITLGSRRRPSESRYVALHVAPTLSDLEELGEDERRVIAITYADNRGMLQRLIVTAPEDRNADAILNWIPRLSWVTGDQPEGTDHVFVPSDSPPEETYNSIILRLDLDQATRIDIPLEKDRLTTAKARMPEGYGLIEDEAR